ncbi:MAG: phosphoenolpyruvate carboxylase, partial [Gammaproteobacteria bacterium]|nr:phosphoenolpyruvate carboxylase [Gammaproteobacteria bacterium]
RRIFEISDKLDDNRLSREEKQFIIDDLETQINLLWNTNEVRVQRPQVRDEVA